MKVKELIDILSKYNLDDDVRAISYNDNAIIQIGNYRPSAGPYGDKYPFFIPHDEITT
jgi:hypothetical protein